ncbi:MAG: hypothetical protein KTR31_26835 [Myxococcales bacterium]|nr:hypothetical protein [Myxococcales bacterium]
MYGVLMLSLATVTGVLGALAIKDSAGFAELSPAAMGLLLVGASVYFMSLAMDSLPTAVVYAVWAGASIGVVFVVDVARAGRQPEPAVVVGIGLILVGIVVLGVFSATPTGLD